MPNPIPTALLAIAVAAACPAQSGPDANSITEARRGIPRALDLLFALPSRDPNYARTITFLIDRTQSVRDAGFESALRLAFERHAAALSSTKVAVAGFGGKPLPGARPTSSTEEVLAACKRLLDAPDPAFHDAYAAIRRVAPTLGDATGQKILVVVTLDNADVESELGATVGSLRERGITTHVITSEAYLADSYWQDKSYRKPPAGAHLRGSDAAIVDLPWGWLFQSAIANEISPAGFTTYGMGRLAAATGGRVHIFTPPNLTEHRCTIYGRCLFCTGDHVQELETYREGRMARIAPELDSREEVMRRLVADPWFRANHRLWQRAADAQLLRSHPGTKLRVGWLEFVSAQRGAWPDWISSLRFSSNARKADRLRERCRELRETYSKELARLDPKDGAPRQRAIAAYSTLLLQITEMNLRIYAAWAREIAPLWTARRGQDVRGPELPEIPEGRRPSGVSFRTLCLCHGVAPFAHVELPGGPKLRDELARLESEVRRYREDWGHTPFAVALHRSGLARFGLTYQGVRADPSRPRVRSKSPDDPATRTPRPKRSGGSSGGSSGPTTGGRR